MQVQVVSKYLTLAEEGLVKKIECPMDQGLLYANQDNNDKIYLYCASCPYIKNIGYEFYGKIKKEVDRALNK